MDMTRPAVSLEDYRAMVGTEVGVSDWVLVDQARIDQFAETTGDHQFIHVDPEAAAKTPFGTTIAHGFLTLSLCSNFAYQALPAVQGVKMGVNYGLNKLRFMAPVKSGKRIRGKFTLADVTQRPDGAWQSTLGVSVEIEGESKPALAAEWVSLQYL
jgi:acyl dehydratase